MFQKAIEELRGDEVIGLDGRIGAVRDVYYDECWKVRYLAVAADASLPLGEVLIAASSANAREGRRHVDVDVACSDVPGSVGPACWFDQAGICSGCDLVGFDVEATDGRAGRVLDLMVDDIGWCIDYLVLELPGGHCSAHVIVPPDWVRRIDSERRIVRLSRTLDDLRHAPRI